jgi:NSS family neurotransmitter:Na+ symporter
MPAGRVWGTMFFVFMAFAALSTVIAVFENIIAMTVDLLGWQRKKSLLVNMIGITICSVPAVLGYNVWSQFQPMGAGSTVMDLEDFIVSYNVLPLGGLLFAMFCVQKNGWGFENFLSEVNTGEGRNFPKWIRGYMTYILPILVLVIYFKGYYDMFKDRVWWQMCLWMGLAVLLAGFVVLLSLYGSKKVRANDNRE